MADIPITEFGIKNIAAAYQELKTTALIVAPMSITYFIGMALIVWNFFDMGELKNEAGDIDASKVVKLIRKYLLYAVLIGGAPFLLYYLETFLGDLQDSAITALGGEPKKATEIMLAEMEEMEKRFPEGPSLFFDSVPDVFAYFNALYVKPVLGLFIRYLYALFISFRYAYLLLLEIVYPIAFVMLFHKETRAIFFKWGGHMFGNFLMIPAFLIGNGLADKAIIMIFNDPYSFIAVLAQFSLKLFLLKRMSDAAFKTI